MDLKTSFPRESELQLRRFDPNVGQHSFTYTTVHHFTFADVHSS